MLYIRLLVSGFGFLIFNFFLKFGVVPSYVTLFLMVFTFFFITLIFRAYYKIFFNLWGNYFCNCISLILIFSATIVISYGRIELNAYLITCFPKLLGLLGIGILILGPTDTLITQMMPGGSEDSANSGNWRDFLNLSPEHEHEQGARANSNDPVTETAVANPPGNQNPGLANEHVEAARQLLYNHAQIADVLRGIFQDLHTRVPGGFQSERLTEMLEERHGGPGMGNILQSLRENGRDSPFFREAQVDFKALRESGATEAALRREWQGRA